MAGPTDWAGHPLSLELTIDGSDMHSLELVSATDRVLIPVGGWTDGGPMMVAASLAHLLRIETIRIIYPEA